MRKHLLYWSLLLVLLSVPTLEAQEAGTTTEAGVELIEFTLPILGEVKIPRDLVWPLLLVGGILALVRYGPETLDRLRDSVGETRTLKRSLELDRLRLENARLLHELKTLGVGEIPASQSGEGGDPVPASLGGRMTGHGTSSLAERRASSLEMIRAQVVGLDQRRTFMWSRVVAFLVDAALVVFITSVLDGLLLSVSFGGLDSLIFLLYLWSGPITFALYFWIMWSTREATVGMMVVGLRIVRLDGHEVTAVDALKRLAIWLLPVPFLGFLWTAVDRNKQSLHDKWPKTLVVRERGKLKSRKLHVRTEGP